VRGNLDRVRAALSGPEDAGSPPLRLALMHQVHGAEVHIVDGGRWPPSGDAGEVPVADALVTAQPDVALVVRVADCVPVLLADGHAGVVGAAHAGRAGLVAGVVPAALAAMRALGAERIRAWVGPHVCGSCYEVPEPLRAEVSAAHPEASASTSWGTPALDIGAGVVAQLVAAGVKVDAASAFRCTVEDDDLFSYRRQGRRSGRTAGLVWRRA
jgi:purine-nucleoside/S-methyl-5'-thioadenosine phosphorylase / adenosine deaminase